MPPKPLPKGGRVQTGSIVTERPASVNTPLPPADDGVTRPVGGNAPGVGAVSFAGAEAAGLTSGYDTSGLLPQLDAATFDATFGTTTQARAIPGAWGTAGGSNKAVDFAASLIGTPYVWGGTSSRGVDCSGLTYLAYKAAGVTLPRVSFQQAAMGQRVSYRNARPGDLVFWDNSPRNNGADHVAIYVGNGQIIEAARPGTNVRRRRLGKDEGAWITRISK